MRVEEAADGARVTAEADVELTGRAAQMGRGIIEDVARRLVGEMAACLEAGLRADAPSATAPADGSGGRAAPLEGGRLMLDVARDRLRRPRVLAAAGAALTLVVGLVLVNPPWEVVMREPAYTLTAGPTGGWPSVEAAMGAPLVYDYDPVFLERFARTERKVAEIFRTSGDVVMMQGEAVLGLEAAARGAGAPRHDRAEPGVGRLRQVVRRLAGRVRREPGRGGGALRRGRHRSRPWRARWRTTPRRRWCRWSTPRRPPASSTRCAGSPRSCGPTAR